MTTLLLAFILLALVIIIMSVGVLMGRKPISGSCGGVGAALGEKDYTCDICGDDPNKCEQQSTSVQNTLSDLAVDATQHKTDRQDK